MTPDPVSNAAAKVTARRAELTATTTLLRRRFDPRLVAADIAKLAMTRSIARVAAISTKPKKRKRAMIAVVVAGATAIALRVLYRNDREKHSPETTEDVKRLQ